VAREATEAHTEEALTVEDHTAVVLARMALELAVTALAALEEPTTSLLEVTEAQLTVLKVAMVVRLPFQLRYILTAADQACSRWCRRLRWC
jgi:hypothetical protein